MSEHGSDDQKKPNQRHDASSPSWRSGLDRVAVNLATTRPLHGDRFGHAVLLFTGLELPDRSQVPARLFPSGQRIRHWIPVKREAGGHLVHIVLDDHPWEAVGYDFDIFARSLQPVRGVLKGVPKTLLPGLSLPPHKDALEESLTAWFSCLHWLAQSPRCLFQSKLEYLETAAALTAATSFNSWHRCPSLAEFDPVPLLTSTDRSGKKLDQWREEHRARGRLLPEVIVASLTKPLWQASLFAIHQLLREEVSLTPITSRRRERKRPVHPDTVRIHELLWDHHLPTKGTSCFLALTGEELKQRSQMKQPKVSRHLKQLMSMVPDLRLEGMDAYKVLCKTGRIKNELVRLGIKCNLPDASKHFQVDDMDSFEDPNSPRPGRS